MQYKKVDKDHFIYIEKNEKVMETITRYCIEKDIKNAKLSGRGAVKETEIGAYDTVAKEYIRKEFSGVLELISFEGNVTLKKVHPLCMPMWFFQTIKWVLWVAIYLRQRLQQLVSSFLGSLMVKPIVN